jgi:hypothetical protein
VVHGPLLLHAPPHPVSSAPPKHFEDEARGVSKATPIGSSDRSRGNTCDDNTEARKNGGEMSVPPKLEEEYKVCLVWPHSPHM